MGKKKKKGNTPRRKRFKKDQRLHNAKTQWLPTTTAKNIAKSYSKWYGVDLLCAIRELEILGHTFTDSYKEQVKVSLESIQLQKRKRKEEKEAQEALDDQLFGSDEYFSFIAGFTPNGVPYGVPWEEE